MEFDVEAYTRKHFWLMIVSGTLFLLFNGIANYYFGLGNPNLTLTLLWGFILFGLLSVGAFLVFFNSTIRYVVFRKFPKDL